MDSSFAFSGGVPSSIPAFFALKQEIMKQAHNMQNQHSSGSTMNNGEDCAPLYNVKYRKEIRLGRYLNQHHQFICALEPCFTTIIPFLTIDDLVRLSSVCGILNNWIMAETVWKKACMSQTQYADLIKRHLRAETWYQLCISLHDDKFNPFRCYIPYMVGGCVNLLRECLLKLLSSIRTLCISNPSIISLSNVPTTLFHTEWLFRCCVSLRNDRHGAVPQGLLPSLFKSILSEYCKIYANNKTVPRKSRSIRWLVSEWSIYQYIVDRLAMLTSKIDDHNYQYRVPSIPSSIPSNIPTIPFNKSPPIIKETLTCKNCKNKSGKNNKRKSPPSTPKNNKSKNNKNNKHHKKKKSSLKDKDESFMHLSKTLYGVTHSSSPLNMLINKTVNNKVVNGLNVHASMCSSTSTSTTTTCTTTTTTTTTTRNNNGIETTTTTITHTSPNIDDACNDLSCSDLNNGDNNIKQISSLIGKEIKNGKKCVMNKIVIKKGKKTKRPKKNKISSSSTTTTKQATRIIINHCTPSSDNNSLTSTTSDNNNIFEEGDDDDHHISDIDTEMIRNLVRMGADNDSDIVEYDEDDNNNDDDDVIDNNVKDGNIKFRCKGCGELHYNDDVDLNMNMNMNVNVNNNKCQCPSCNNGKKYIVRGSKSKSKSRKKMNKLRNHHHRKTTTHFSNNVNHSNIAHFSGQNGDLNGLNIANMIPGLIPTLNNLNSSSNGHNLPIHLQLFGEYFLKFNDCSCIAKWRELSRQLEVAGQKRLLAECAIIYESVGLKGYPRKWLPIEFMNRSYYQFYDFPVTIYYKNEYFKLSRSAASLSPYIREFMGRSYHCIVDLSWIDGEKHHLKKLLSFLEYHIVEPMPHIPTPVRSKKLSRVVPKWYSDFAIQCDRKDCFIMILIGNGLAIAPLVHLFCARIATMIKSLKPEEVREIMALEEDVQKNIAKQQQQQQQLQQQKQLNHHIDSDDNIIQQSIPF